MKYTCISDIGKLRKINEDNCAVFLKSNGMILALVADGIGGGLAGEVASAMTVEIFRKAFEEKEFDVDTNIYRFLRDTIEDANYQVLKDGKVNKDHFNMGTTVVGCLITFTRTYVFNVGDSRLYFVTDELKPMTHDHTILASMIELGLLEENEKTNGLYRNYLSSALGTERIARVDIEAFDNDYQQILICSDGLYGYVKEENIQNVLLSELDVNEKGKQLIDLANEAGGYDNISVIILEKGDRHE